MERKEPTRKITSRIRTTEAAAPAAGAPARRAGGASPRKGGAVGERLKASSKPPSKIGRAIKFLMILIVFVGMPGIIVAGFFVKSGTGRSIWHQLAINLGVLEAPKKKFNPGTERAMKPLDVGYNNALISRTKAEFYINSEIKKADDQPDDL